MAFLGKTTTPTGSQFSLKEHFMAKRMTSSSMRAHAAHTYGTANGSMSHHHHQSGQQLANGISSSSSVAVSAASASSTAAAAEEGGGVDVLSTTTSSTDEYNEQDEQDDEQPSNGVAVRTNNNKSMRNSYVDAPFRVQTNSTAETIDVVISQKEKARGPAMKSRLSMSRTSEDLARTMTKKALVTVPVQATPAKDEEEMRKPIPKKPPLPIIKRAVGVEPQNVTAIVLAGGVGEQNPMTKKRAVSALNIAGSFRLIDFPLAACLQAMFGKVFVLTQYNSRSLNNHVSGTFSKSSTMGRSTTEVCVLPMSATPSRDEWPRGSAAAVRAHLEAQSFDIAIENGVSGQLDKDKAAYLVCSGEQLHKIDYTDVLRTHNESDAAITMLVQNERCKSSEVEKMHMHTESGHLKVGLTEIEKSNVVKRIHEKPKFSEGLFREIVDKDERHSYHVSTGNYIVSAEAMKELLVENPPRERGQYFEFGEHVINTAIERGMKVVAHKYEGYWTPLRNFSEWFRTNIEMAKGGPASELIAYGSGQSIISQSRFLPPAKFVGFSRVEESLILDGCVIRSGERGSFIESSIVGPCTQVGENVRLKNTIIVGSPDSVVKSSIGENSELDGVVLDSGANVGRDCVLRSNGCNEVREELQGMIEIVDGIVCVMKDCNIPDGTKM